MDNEPTLESVAKGTSDMKKVAFLIHHFKSVYFCKSHMTYFQKSALGIHFELFHRNEYELVEQKDGKLLRDGKDPMKTALEGITKIVGKEKAAEMMDIIKGINGVEK